VTTPVPESLPPWLQTLLYLAGLIGAGFAAMRGWRNKQAERGSEAPNALIAGDIMDTKPMKDLVHEVGHLREAVDRMVEAQERGTDATNRMHDAERSTESAIRDLCRTVERKLQ